MRKFKKRELAFDIGVHVLTLLICAMLMFPLLYVVFMSFSSPRAVFYGEVVFFPKELSIASYREFLKHTEIFQGFWVTVQMVGIGTLLSLFFTMGLSYALSRKDLKGRKVISALCVFTMFFSGGLIPLFIVVQSLHLYNTLWAMILPCSVSVWNVIVVRTFISGSIPHDLEEAAAIDGASNFRIFFQVVLPLCKSVIAIMILFYAVGYWNSYFYPLVFVSPSNTKLKPLQLVMQDILLNDGGSGGGESALQLKMLAESLKYSSIVVTTLPILIAYPFLAKHLEKGMMIGSVKG